MALAVGGTKYNPAHEFIRGIWGHYINNIMEKTELIARIDSALNDVRPHLAVDGGNVEVVDVTDDKIVKIKWLGNCQNCNMSIMTMRAGIEQAIRVKVPEITGVEAVNGLVL